MVAMLLVSRMVILRLGWGEGKTDYNIIEEKTKTGYNIKNEQKWAWCDEKNVTKEEK